METGTSIPAARPGKQGPGEKPAERDALVQLSGIWSNRSKSGEWYGRGASGNVVYLVIPNKRKKKASEPDYQLCVCKRPPKKDEPAAGPQPAPSGEEIRECDENGVVLEGLPQQ